MSSGKRASEQARYRRATRRFTWRRRMAGVAPDLYGKVASRCMACTGNFSFTTYSFRSAFHLILAAFPLLLQVGAEQSVEGRRVLGLSPACPFFHRDFGFRAFDRGRHTKGFFASFWHAHGSTCFDACVPLEIAGERLSYFVLFAVGTIRVLSPPALSAPACIATSRVAFGWLSLHYYPYLLSGRRRLARRGPVKERPSFVMSGVARALTVSLQNLGKRKAALVDRYERCARGPGVSAGGAAAGEPQAQAPTRRALQAVQPAAQLTAEEAARWRAQREEAPRRDAEARSHYRSSASGAAYGGGSSSSGGYGGGGGNAKPTYLSSASQAAIAAATRAAAASQPQLAALPPSLGPSSAAQASAQLAPVPVSFARPDSSSKAYTYPSSAGVSFPQPQHASPVSPASSSSYGPPSASSSYAPSPAQFPSPVPTPNEFDGGGQSRACAPERERELEPIPIPIPIPIPAENDAIHRAGPDAPARAARAPEL
ncbi:hypothetical protein B0H13DRAFT_1850323 [Mycena leptocephala]|nr:hypothetical protein B0H13DRAFT_1921361 [Mycena leptocephala]KAJ7940136.1 hypothetical protein B0H13DRAFT_1850323 [Mycena leptocephala]